MQGLLARGELFAFKPRKKDIPTSLLKRIKKKNAEKRGLR
jgi:hypothetical protein